MPRKRTQPKIDDGLVAFLLMPKAKPTPDCQHDAGLRYSCGQWYCKRCGAEV